MTIAQARAEALRRAGSLRLHAFLWNSLGRGSIAYALSELLDNMPPDHVERRLWCLSGEPSPSARRDYHHPIFPHLLYRAFSKARVPAAVQGRMRSPTALRAIKPGDFVYVWPDFDLTFIKRAQDRGATVIAERTNVMGAMGRAAFTRAFARRGKPLPTGWYPPEVIARERAQMTQCDYVVARNAFVSQSLRDVGIRQDRIIEGSYGFSPERLGSAIGAEKPSRPPVFAFVGVGNFGKGFDVLLEAWEKARVSGTLLIAGKIDDEIRALYGGILARPDVQLLGFVDDVARVYAAADVFVFPSHAEGGPQVVYEAAACGLPSIISPMGAGRMVRHGKEGLIIDPLEVDDLTDALKRLAEDQELRRILGSAAAKRAAAEFTWENVGRHLCDEFNSIRLHAELASATRPLVNNRR